MASPTVVLAEWTDIELAALSNFLAAPGHLKSGLEKFITQLAFQQKTLCTVCMASVPRDTERAADHAAKAQILDDFWAILADQLTSSATPLQEPTLEERRRSNG